MALLKLAAKRGSFGGMGDNDSIDLSGKMLVAMPGMGDPRFEKAVVFVCVHSSQGAMGLIINKPAPDVNMPDLLKRLDLPDIDSASGLRAHFGGPVDLGRGFVLHSPDAADDDATLKIDQSFAMTATLDMLAKIATGNGPDSAILMLGYSGWGPGQLESELGDNGWLTCDAVPSIVFGPDSETKWQAALNSLGIDPVSLSATAGRA